MNTIRKLICSVAAIAIALSALSAVAASSSKSFYVVFPALIGGGTNQSIEVTFYNTSPPPGLSTINSISIKPANGVTIKDVKPGSAFPSGNADGSWIVNDIPGIKRGASQKFTITADVAMPCVNGTWSAAANTGNAYPQGDAFARDDSLSQLASACSGILNCGDTTGFYGSAVLSQSGFEGQADWGLVRGSNTSCTLVPYLFNFNSITRNASFIVGNKGTQEISAEYVVVFDPVPYAGSPTGSWPVLRPKLAWGTFASSTPVFPTDYVPALACLNDEVNITAAGGADTDVLPVIPSETDFINAAATNPQYTPGNRARMCVANHGWTAIRNPAGFPPGAYLQPWYKIIDRSDGYVRLP